MGVENESGVGAGNQPNGGGGTRRAGERCPFAVLSQGPVSTTCGDALAQDPSGSIYFCYFTLTTDNFCQNLAV